MKTHNTIILLITILTLANLIYADIIEQNDYIIFTCNNATDGSLLCSSATIDLYDSNGNIAVSGASATNIATGKFKYQVKNSTDRYTVIIDCCTGAIDYAFQVYVTPYTETKANYLDASISSRSTLTASDNIGVNLNDITGTLDLNELGFNPALQSNLTQGIITLSSTTETQIDNIEADTNELQQNQNWNVWDDGTRTLTACPCSGWATPTDVDNNCISESELNSSHGSCNYCTATGFSTHSAADVYSYFTSGSNEDAFKADVSSLATQGNISDLQAHGDLYWNTSTGALTSEQNQTLYDIYAVVGEKDKWDQSIADMIGYNTSDGNVETDLDSTGGTTPSAVYAYFTDSGRALNETNGWLSNVVGHPNDFDQTIAEMLNYNVSEGNVETDLDSAGGTTPEAVWSYSIRTITGGNLTNPDDYKADISSLATQSNISDLKTHGDSNWATATGFSTPSDITSAKNDILSHGDQFWNTSTLSASDIWSYASRTLTAFNFRVNVTKNAVKDIWGNEIYNDNLVLSLSMDETSGNTVYDSSENDNDCSFVNSENLSRVNGKFGRGIQFKGFNGYLDCGNDQTLNISTEFTISFWVKISKENETSIMEKGLWSNGWDIANYDPNGLNLRSNGFNSVDHYASNLFNTNEWTHIVYTYDSSLSSNNLRLYRNGELNKTWTESGGLNTSNTATLKLGRAVNGAKHLNGTLDEVLIFSRALTSDEVSKLYLATRMQYIASETLNNTNRIPNNIWSYALRTLTSFTFPVNLTTNAINDIDLRINQSHGEGYYNESGTGASPSEIWSYSPRSVNLTTPAIDAIDSRLNKSHGTGAWNGTPSNVTADVNYTKTAQYVWSYALAHNLNANETLVAIYDSIILSGFSASTIQNPFYFAYYYCDKYAKLLEGIKPYTRQR